MSENDIVRARRLPEGTVVQVLPDGSPRPFADRTGWARLEAMTAEEIGVNALSDPDNVPLADEELARMRPVPHPRGIRERLELTQEQIATKFEVPLRTLRDWEQGMSFADNAAKTLLWVIALDPGGDDQRAGANVSRASPNLARYAFVNTPFRSNSARIARNAGNSG